MRRKSTMEVGRQGEDMLISHGVTSGNISRQGNYDLSPEEQLWLDKEFLAWEEEVERMWDDDLGPEAWHNMDT
jgi:hypothetical protein